MTAVVEEDTDLLVLLAHHASTTSEDIFFFSDRSGKDRKWNIRQLIEMLGEVRHLLIVLHAITGCDTTSSPYNIEKCTALKKLIGNKKLSSLARLFLEDAERHYIHTEEKKMLVLLHNGQSSDTLDELTHHVFCKKIAVGSSCTEAESLPPTSAAARYHSEGVYCQVQQWMGKSSLKASKWEWRIENSLCLPKMTAPEDLLNVSRCTCKEHCDTKRCSCKKDGLLCSPACKECHGISCFNSVPANFSEEMTDM